MIDSQLRLSLRPAAITQCSLDGIDVLVVVLAEPLLRLLGKVLLNLIAGDDDPLNYLNFIKLSLYVIQSIFVIFCIYYLSFLLLSWLDVACLDDVEVDLTEAVSLVKSKLTLLVPHGLFVIYESLLVLTAIQVQNST